MNDKTIIINSKIFSIDLSGKENTYNAMVIENGKFKFLGTNNDALKFKDDKTNVIDLNGKLILPAFCDSHGHMSLNAEFLYTCDLYDVEFGNYDDPKKAINLYLDRIKEYYKNNPNINLLRASGWSTKMYTEDTFPTRYDLDKISTEIPICVQSNCHHYYWVNSKVLELAGINSNTTSLIHKDKNGEPSGIVQEFSAKRLIENSIANFDYTVSQYKTAILDFCNKYSKMGVLACYDAIPTRNALLAYKELAMEDKLNIRFRCAYTAYCEDDFTQFDKMIESFNKNEFTVNDLLKTDSVKFFNDGVGDCCLFEEEFEDRPGFLGDKIWETDRLAQAFIKVLNGGLHIHVHSIGEGTTRETLNAFEYAQNSTGIFDRRNAITHLCRMKDSDVNRISKLKIVAVMQPYWMVGRTEIDMEPPSNEKIARMTYKNKSLLDNGIIVCGSDDFPVDGPYINPLECIQIGATRHLTKSQINKYKIQNVDYENLQPFCMPSECASVKEMIKEYTINGAYANSLEKITGSIEIGKSADFQVLSDDILNLKENEIENTKVEMVFFKGRIIKE